MNHIPAFFSRIGLDPNTPPELTYDFLARVRHDCVTHIAYENLDILDGVSLTLD